MKYKTLALAVAGLVAAPALAQTSNVTLYGRANLGIDQYSHGGTAIDPDGAGPRTSDENKMKSRTRIYDAASRIGVRGVEDLGGGLRAIFQIETGANVDNGSQTGQGQQQNTSSGFLASRDSFVGLEGGFGRVTLGRQSVWWVNGTIIQTGANYINAEVPWLNMASMGRLGVGVARNSNTLIYTTPTFGGFNISGYYSPDSTGTGTTGAAAQCAQGANVFPNSECIQNNNKTDARIFGFTPRFAIGPVSLQADYVRRQAASGFSVAGVSHRPTNEAWKVLGGWTYLPGAQISAIYGQLRAKDSGNLFGGTVDSDLKQSMWGLSWEHTFGNIQALAQYSQLGKISGNGCVGVGIAGCDNTKARGWTVGVRYLHSKRTASYITYNEVRNQDNQFADYTGGAITSANAANGLAGTNYRGADPRIIAIGVIHNF